VYLNLLEKTNGTPQYPISKKKKEGGDVGRVGTNACRVKKIRQGEQFSLAHTVLHTQ
jgi:hypothetical protein